MLTLRLLAFAFAALLLAALVGCAGVSPTPAPGQRETPPSGAPPGGAPPAPGAPPGAVPGAVPGGALPAPTPLPAPHTPTLAEEQRRLRSLFEGTPVVVEMTSEGRLRVEVPLKHSFDPGRAAIKPALGAVLDRVATGLRMQPTADVRITAPGESPILAADRAASTRDYLIARGVPAARFADVGAGQREAVELSVGDRAAH